MKIKSILILDYNNGVSYEVGKSYSLEEENVKVTEIRHINNDEYLVTFDDGSELGVFCKNVLVYRT
jgi:DUF971 family protein